MSRGNRESVFVALAHQAATTDPRLTEERVRESLAARERQSSTVLAPGIAIPHAILPEAGRFQVLPVVVSGGAEWGNSLSPITLIFGIIGPSDQPWNHVQLLARVARILRDPAAVDRLLGATDGATLDAAVRAEDERHD
ncbi:MAG: PTS sugar transporter subunit IIA [Planctomycetota bacterium]|nr:PTS sugar transporter subunit IIA [Planctomycetota bacterium]MDA1105678.1 PTS sugar transporter subunit IIA [Planctomycetota bacterium]